MKDEAQIMQQEWLQYAKDDLESAGVILAKTDNYHISVYHSHQAIEKLCKWFLLKNNQKFPFSHDLKQLFNLVCQVKDIKQLLEEILVIDNLYPQLRYPTGEKISKSEAEKCLKIADKVFAILIK
ncbi:MAG: HEPN domain-containing protein [bacterium]